jgi:hypothetical protein|tara:strand:+ start:66 stop:299 length:234 start_codon:yes stop_codon:yes gene_type:complete
MSETATVSDIVSLSLSGESAGVKSAIGDVLQQKIMVALENKKKEVGSSFLTKTRENSEVVTADAVEIPIETQEVETS